MFEMAFARKRWRAASRWPGTRERRCLAATSLRCRARTCSTPWVHHDPHYAQRRQALFEKIADDYLAFVSYCAAAQGVRCTCMKAHDQDPALAIAAMASREGCDLVYMASHGWKGDTGRWPGGDDDGPAGLRFRAVSAPARLRTRGLREGIRPRRPPALRSRHGTSRSP